MCNRDQLELLQICTTAKLSRVSHLNITGTQVNKSLVTVVIILKSLSCKVLFESGTSKYNVKGKCKTLS